MKNSLIVLLLLLTTGCSKIKYIFNYSQGILSCKDSAGISIELTEVNSNFPSLIQGDGKLLLRKILNTDEILMGQALDSESSGITSFRLRKKTGEFILVDWTAIDLEPKITRGTCLN